MNDVMRDNYVDLNAETHDYYIIPVDRLNVAGADQSTHSVLSTYPTLININARSLNAEKVDELQVSVDDYDIDVACRGRGGITTRLRFKAPWLEICVRQDCDISHSE